MTSRVRLECTWRWACPGCGETNYHDGLQVRDESLREDLAELDAALSADPLGLPGGFSPTDYAVLPEVVFCRRCEGRYDVQGPDGDVATDHG